MNLNVEPADFPAEIAEIATSVSLNRTRPGAPRALHRRAAGQARAWLDTWTEEGFEPVRGRGRRWPPPSGQDVLVRADNRELSGIAEDIDDTGALLLRVGDKLERVLSGDVEQVRSRKS